MSDELLRADVCVVACADAWRHDGEILASPTGTIPSIAVRLARATFAPDLMLADGEAAVVAGAWAVGEPAPGPVESWLPYRTVFDIVWSGKRHVMMVPSQIDQYGNANISAIGDFDKPTRQLLGVRGAPGNTINHPTSYWIAKHQTRAFVPRVDMVSGVGYDSAARAGGTVGRYLDLRRIVTNLAVLDFATPDHRMRLVSVHPGVTVEEVRRNTGFDLVAGDDVHESRRPTEEEDRLIREVLDPHQLRLREVPRD